MGKPSFFDNVREWIGGIVFAILLWSLRMTADEYYDMQELNAAHLPNGADSEQDLDDEDEYDLEYEHRKSRESGELL